MNVCQSQIDYFNNRLALVEERIFSYPNLYQRAKITSNDDFGYSKNTELTTVYNVHSVIGSTRPKWILGILSQKEDANYYLEDSTLVVRVSFTDLNYVDPNFFFTECSIILCSGLHINDIFKIHRIVQPPLMNR